MKRKKTSKKSKKPIILCGVFSASVIAGYFAGPYVLNFAMSSFDETMRFLCFNVKNINIYGASEKTQNLIMNNLGLTYNDNIFKLNSDQISDNLKKITWIKEFSVKKILPNTINIKVIETVPIAIFQNDTEFYLIDESGNFIEKVKSRSKGLPIISGKEANLRAKEILSILDKFPEIRYKIETMTYISTRRWDIEIDGLKIKLPDNNISDALKKLQEIMKIQRINKNTAKYIDLRNSDVIYIGSLKISNIGDLSKFS